MIIMWTYYVKYVEVQSCLNLWLAKMVCFGAVPMQLIKPFLKRNIRNKTKICGKQYIPKMFLLFWYAKTYSDYFEVITKPLVYTTKIYIF